MDNDGAGRVLLTDRLCAGVGNELPVCDSAPVCFAVTRQTAINRHGSNVFGRLRGF
jgi:hypothetical protein